MAITLKQLAQQLSAELRGEGSLAITGARSLEQARRGEIAFVADEANARRLKTKEASAVLVGRHLSESLHLADIPQAVLIVEDAKRAFLQVLGIFHPPRRRIKLGISSHANVHPSAQIGQDTNVHPGAHIGEDVVIGDHCDIHPGVCVGPGCRIGDHVTLYPNVVLYHDVHIGQRVVIQAGAVIGTDGFGYQLVEGRHQKLPHFGIVRIEDDVEVGANATIDRALVAETVIGAGTKLDNLVQIAHNCEIGKHNLMAGHVAIAGSVSTGDYVVCAGQAGIADHVHVGDQAVLAAQTGVSKSLPGGKTYFGTPAHPIEETRKQMSAVRRLPQLREQVRELAAQIKIIQAQLEALTNSPATPDDDSAGSASAA